MFYPCAAGPGVQISSTMDYQKNCLVLNIFIIRKAAVILDFCLFGNIRRNFLVPRIIESAHKTFRPIQLPDLQRVLLERKPFYLKYPFLWYAFLIRNNFRYIPEHTFWPCFNWSSGKYLISSFGRLSTLATSLKQKMSGLILQIVFLGPELYL